MQQYQEEYISNVKEFVALSVREKEICSSFDEYEGMLQQNRQRALYLIQRNTELLRGGLFPLLNHMPEVGREELADLQEFAGKLLDGKSTLDAGLFCRIHGALLNMARIQKDRNGMIRELYWLGYGYNSTTGKLSAIDDKSVTEEYDIRMRLCFTEAAAYLKYFDEIEDDETRGYIIRAFANRALGRFKVSNEKIHMVKQTLQVLNDKYYREIAPDLPWDKYLFMTHQQMTASMSHSKEHPMTPQEIADVMESVYIVYQQDFQNADFVKFTSRRKMFSYYSIDFYCGLDTIEGLLTKLERIMDEVEPDDFSLDGMYGHISLPAFYCQYLTNYPERLSKRQVYVSELYRRILGYMDTVPRESENNMLFLYLRQLSHTFVEVDGGITYGEYLQKILKRFAPAIYKHSYTVGRAAVYFCEQIYAEDSTYFDDIEHIRAVADPQEKYRAVLDYAMCCGLFHDVGKIDFLDIYSLTARQWFEEEYSMAHLHTHSGREMLQNRASTKIYADVALGHHGWYDGSNGYPEQYRRLECPARQMVDIITLVNWLDNVSTTSWLYTGMRKTFDEAVQEAVSREGRRFSPLLTAWLQDKEIARGLWRVIEKARYEADYILYQEAK